MGFIYDPNIDTFYIDVLPNNPNSEVYIGGNLGTNAACSNTSIPENKGWVVVCGDD